ncbi:liver-expressed antimicrobial peptide 2 [Dicentrarchus labrax]|uniref:Liver-expressed antimicrobial peptide 2 n=1 Tax=Dicentrarchus labrax TaxID=13489 RepID=A0A8P4GJN5_DICLA|nr:liver-expressed antimicrobial peptide 2 [Dicentrarchus labrax]
MQETGFFTQRRAAVALCFVLLVLAQQVCAGPLVAQVQSSPDQRGASNGVRTLRRIARMTPLWRIMNSKPFGAYCQNNYECSTGICRAGHCSASHRGPSETVNY